MQLNKRITRNYKPIFIKKTSLLLAISYFIICGWLIYANSEGHTNVIVCPSKLLYKIPCPGCGITRATLKFLHFDYIAAIRLNPNVILSIVYLTFTPIIIILNLLSEKDVVKCIYNYINHKLQKKFIWIPFLIIELLIWIHNVLFEI